MRTAIVQTLRAASTVNVTEAIQELAFTVLISMSALVLTHVIQELIVLTFHPTTFVPVKKVGKS